MISDTNSIFASFQTLNPFVALRVFHIYDFREGLLAIRNRNPLLIINIDRYYILRDYKVSLFSLLLAILGLGEIGERVMRFQRGFVLDGTIK